MDNRTSRLITAFNRLDAIPTAQTIERLEQIVRKLEAPEKLELRFAQGRVTTLTPDQSLDQVLKLVQKKAYSQFPVIREDTIAGLLFLVRRAHILDQ